jgi:archaeal type IV pilus assembly protein PilA
MDFNKLFRKDDKAVSPVIGVILMVAITVILAAAIGSSVFSHGTAQSAPQANIDLKAASTPTGNLGTVKMEHLGGDQINFGNTKVTAYVGVNNTTVSSLSGTFNVGDVKTFTVGDATVPVVSGTSVEVKFVDSQTNQLICDKTVRFP